MQKTILALIFVLAFPLFAAAQVLIVADEFPAMQVLAGRLKGGEGMESRIVKQEELPPELTPFSAVIVYIHGSLGEPTEKACVGYANSGGKLILLHHSISSGKRANQFWFPFLGVSLPTTPLEAGGYKYFDPVTMEIVNLAPADPLTSRKIRWEAQTSYRSPSDAAEKPHPAFTLTKTEVYLNHVLTGPRTYLLGVKYTDPATGKTWMQDTAGWYKPAGKGWVFYFMPGHSATEFEHPIYSQIVLNAVVWKAPEGK
jgi:hypothetical protein